MRKLAILCSIATCASLQAQVSPPANLPATNAATGPVVAPAPVDPPVSAPSVVVPPVATPARASAPTTVAAPASEAPAANPSGRTAYDIQDEEVGVTLRNFARQARINIFVSDQIKGTISMRVENLTPLEAIKIIVNAKGLNMSQLDNVYYIKTKEEKEKEPTESGSYTFSYAKAPEILALITTQIQSGVAPQIDVRTNTVYYRDFKSNLSNLALFLESIDRPTQQVMIEARLVEVNANPKQSYGINWAGTLGGSQTAQNFQYGGSGLNSYKMVTAKTQTGVNADGSPQLTDKLDSNGFPVMNAVLDTLPTYNTTGVSNFVTSGKNLGQAIGGQFAILNIPQMSATLRFLNEDADTEFLANPRIVTANNLKADIKIVRNQPVPKLNFNEQTATAVFSGFEDKIYGNTLSVTPTINKDNFVTMLVKPEISNRVGDQVFTFAGATVTSPIIDTRTLESNVLIKSGDTLAIGGLLQNESLKQTTKVPILGDIPVLGYLFQEHVNARNKRNLLVFITPTIIKQGYGTGLENQISGLKNSGEEFADPNGWRNNAKGAIRIVPTSNRQMAADYPKPGAAPAPVSASGAEVKKNTPKFKVTVPDREQ